MQQRIVVVGCGFAGMWSALSARRLIEIHGKTNDIEVVVIAPDASLVLRPRLYEADVAGMKAPLDELFQVTGIQFVKGLVKDIDTDKETVQVSTSDGQVSTISYDRLVLAVGSRLVHHPKVAGLAEHAFDMDSIDAAIKLEAHMKNLASLPPSPARDTVVVCGAGFTGIEAATELPSRLRQLWGAESKPKVVLVGNAPEVGPELGPGPRPVILQALKELGVEVKLGSAVTSVDAAGTTLASGEHIPTMTSIWTAGVEAMPLLKQISGEKDGFGRIMVDRNLRVPSAKHVFATGDAAHALTGDTEGHCAMMSCQHANILGRSSGNNAAADLIGVPTSPYSQPSYGTCLDLGAYGAVVTKGWEREVVITGAAAKQVKQFVNQTLIYPPKADPTEAFAAAEPVAPDFVKELENGEMIRAGRTEAETAAVAIVASGAA